MAQKGRIDHCPRSWDVDAYRRILDEPAAADLNARVTAIFADDMVLTRWLLTHNGNIDDQMPSDFLARRDFRGVLRVLNLEYPQAA